MIKICEYCGKKFTAKTKKQKFCSRECSHKNMSKKVICTCDNCGKAFERKQDEYIKNKHHFCSWDCKIQYSHETRYCKLCGREFDTKKGENRIYCSHECAINDISHNQKTHKEWYICKECGKEFEAHVSAQRQFCSTNCKYKYLAIHPSEKTIKIRTKRKENSVLRFYEKYDQKNSPFELLEDYIPGNKILCKCKEHNQTFYMTAYNILDGENACTQCYMSKGELQIQKFLEDKNIDYIPYFRFSDCKDKKPLPFDFYLPDKNILIEYDGEQHFHPVNYEGINDNIALENFEIVKMHDKIKTEYCYDHNITLIRISYTDFENINNILSQKIA